MHTVLFVTVTCQPTLVSTFKCYAMEQTMSCYHIMMEFHVTTVGIPTHQLMCRPQLVSCYTAIYTVYIYICDRACDNQPCECKIADFFVFA